MAEIDLGQVKMTDAELMNLILQFNGGVRLGKDENGNAGYIATDEETGADTVIPFSSGGGEIEGIDVLKHGGTTSTSNSTLISAGNFTFNIEKKYKNLLFVFFYDRTSSRYNYPKSLTFAKGSTGTYEINEIWSYNDFSTTNLFTFIYAALWGAADVGEVFNYSVTLTLNSSTTDSGQKKLIPCILGIY